MRERLAARRAERERQRRRRDEFLARMRRNRKAYRTLRTRAKRSARLVRRLRRRIMGAQVPGVVDGGWHPHATRIQVQGGIGAFLNVPAKLVWHTTEGFGLPAYSGSHPHFTLDPASGKLWQHIPVTSGAMTLKNASGGVETNRAHAIQVELIGFAGETPDWPASDYREVAELARWIEKHTAVKRRCSVRFEARHHSLSGQEWLDYSGHIGHQHVPENDHWDPGQFRIGEVI